ncbi:MAG: SAM-dependent chlorinase/fluorinase [Tepidisphaeraceae bacterium]
MAYKPNLAHPIVTLTTDFGLSDPYVAAMKGAILRESPNAVLVDVTHNVPPGDVLCGSISLERAVDGFGAGAVHLAVVDPGVGTDRRILLVQIRGSIIVCPDNGLITWTWRRLGPGMVGKLIWRPRMKASDTFHGRDIMGPVAGMLASGRDPVELARAIDDPILLDFAPAPPPVKSGRIIHIDHFGNATTNIARDSLKSIDKLRVRVGRKRVGRLKRTYVDAAPGCALALFGSSGLLEIAVRDGSAAKALRLRVGDEVVLDNRG